MGVPINQLARPKSVKYECEVCGKPATLKCLECPTYYCTQEHFDIDWRGIPQLIAQDIVVLRERPKMIGSEEERDRRAEELMGIRKELLELCTETAQKFLVQGKYELAVPGALQSLKFAIEVHGSEALQAFATDIYHSSHESDRVGSFYTKVVDIYAKFLEDWMNMNTFEPSSEIGPVEVEEAIEIVRHISEYRETQSGEATSDDHARVETAEGRYTLGLLQVYTNDIAASRESLIAALEVFHAALGPNHDRTKACQTCLEQLERRGAERQAEQDQITQG